MSIRNYHDPFAVVVKSGNIVSHIPRLISAAYYAFLGWLGCTNYIMYSYGHVIRIYPREVSRYHVWLGSEEIII